MATLQQIKNKVDAFLVDAWTNKVLPREQQYFANHGRFAQITRSPLIMPADDATGDFSNTAPHDEVFPGEFLLDFATPIPAQLEIHVHDKDGEHGFTAHVFVQVLGKIYHRAKNYQFGEGDVPWHEVLLK